jgi:YidC/Oxa1 family membrane protein insertase
MQWCSNLAGPDCLWYWEPYLLDFFVHPAEGWLGPYFNLLPMATIALFLVHQKLFMPPATDEQTRIQHQVMTFMTVFMGVMFFRVPAGLCIYFIVSSLWGIVERTWLLPKPATPGPVGKDLPSPSGPATGKPGGAPTKPGGGAKSSEAMEGLKSLFGMGGNGTSKLTPKERRKQRQKKR